MSLVACRFKLTRLLQLAGHRLSAQMWTCSLLRNLIPQNPMRCWLDCVATCLRGTVEFFPACVLLVLGGAVKFWHRRRRHRLLHRPCGTILTFLWKCACYKQSACLSTAAHYSDGLSCIVVSTDRPQWHVSAVAFVPLLFACFVRHGPWQCISQCTACLSEIACSHAEKNLL